MLFQEVKKIFFSYISAVHVHMGVCAYMDAMPLTWRSQGCMDIQRARPFTLLLINFIENYWWRVTYLTRQTAAITLTTSVIMLVCFASIDLASKVRPSSLWKTMLRPYWKSTISNNEKQGKMKHYFTLTVEPGFNKGPRDHQNLFAITRFRYITVLFHIFYYYWGEENCLLYRGLHYIEVCEVPLYIAYPNGTVIIAFKQ